MAPTVIPHIDGPLSKPLDIFQEGIASMHDLFLPPRILLEDLKDQLFYLYCTFVRFILFSSPRILMYVLDRTVHHAAHGFTV